MKDKEIILDIKGRDYKVKIGRFSAEEAEITVNDTTYYVGLKDLGVETVSEVKPQQAPRGVGTTAPQTAASKKPAAGSALHRPKEIADGSTITAPLPGLITKIFIKEGDVIEPGRKVLMLEAMKMENEVNADKGGMVINISHKEGSSVNQGDVLIMLKPVEG